MVGDAHPTTQPNLQLLIIKKRRAIALNLLLYSKFGALRTHPTIFGKSPFDKGDLGG